MTTNEDGIDVEVNLRVPTTKAEVTEDWLAKALQLDMKSGTVAISNDIPSGYLGDILRAKYTARNPQGEHKDLSIVVKLLPEEKFARDLVLSEKMDRTELGVYTKLLSAFTKEIPSLEPYICKLMYGKIQEENSQKGFLYSSVLILKDLKVDGYVPKPYKSHKISPGEIESIIDFFAKFHVAGKFVELREKKRLNELFDFFPAWYYPNKDPNQKFLMHSWFIEGFGYTRQAIQTYIKNASPEVVEIGKKMISEMIDPLEPYAQKIFNFILEAGKQHPAAIHGDLWQNNVLFPQEANIPIKVIDWQLLGYSDPVYDLGWFLSTALQEDLNWEKLEHYTKLYHNKVEELYAQRSAQGLPVLPGRRSWTDLWEAFSTFGLVFNFVMTISCGEILITHPENNPKLFSALKFMQEEMKITNFLLKNLA